MERLISSFSSKTHLPKSPVILPPRLAVVERSSLLRLQRSSLRPLGAQLSKEEGPPPLIAASSSRTQGSPLVWPVKKAGEGVPGAQLGSGRDLACLVLRKVNSAAFFVLMIILVATTVQPLIALPAYAAVQSATKAGGRLVGGELISSAWAGFFAGCLHTLSGPDHLAALAPLSIGRTRLESALVGALWGCGHDAGQVIFGLLFLLLKDRLHIEIIRTWGTRVVGLTLLIIGAMGIKEASEVHTPCVAMGNGEYDRSIVESLQTEPSGKKKIGFATFATGIVHGLQPDALVMVLPALALPSRLAGAAFLGMFLVGTVFAMGSYTVFLGSCSQALKERVPRITEKLTWAASLVAIFMGIAILVSQFLGFSLY
ncbi:chloroplast protein FOR GROWTH AND FERTILITY 2-like [Typha latifolia]|uniref:chloroplast protein FOR GROWTH AND FERTILITY 2-like n=1 Tax=Typha latifolia TaxID=4733 RepID=UPI003C2BE4EB